MVYLEEVEEPGLEPRLFQSPIRSQLLGNSVLERSAIWVALYEEAHVLCEDFVFVPPSWRPWAFSGLWEGPVRLACDPGGCP